MRHFAVISHVTARIGARLREAGQRGVTFRAGLLDGGDTRAGARRRPPGTVERPQRAWRGPARPGRARRGWDDEHFGRGPAGRGGR